MTPISPGSYDPFHQQGEVKDLDASPYAATNPSNRGYSMELSIRSVFSQITAIATHPITKRKAAKRIASDMHRISESMIYTTLAAANKAWVMSDLENDHQRLAVCLGAADEMLIAIYMFSSQEVKNTILQGTVDPIIYLGEMRRSARMNILEERNKLMMRTPYIYEENIFNDQDMTSYIKNGKAFIQYEMLYSQQNLSESEDIQQEVNGLAAKLSVARFAA